MSFPLTLTTDVGGVPYRWVNFKDVCYYDAKDLIIWKYGIHSYEVRGGYQDGVRSVVEIPSIIGIDGIPEKKFSRNVPHLKSKTLFRRDHHICAYCGREFDERDLTIDHITPKSMGGASSWMNCVASCVRCNMSKAARTPEEANMKLLYVPYVPDKEEWLILMNKKILNDQMEFLKGMIRNKDSRMFDNNI